MAETENTTENEENRLKLLQSMVDKIDPSEPFYELCRTGNHESIKQWLDSNTGDYNDCTIGLGFQISCACNLDNAKWLYANYKKECDTLIRTTCFFARGLILYNKVETVLWLKSLNNDDFIAQIDLLFGHLINERRIDRDEFKFLYEHFFDRFEYYGTQIRKDNM